jgi:hypothetical protein
MTEFRCKHAENAKKNIPDDITASDDQNKNFIRFIRSRIMCS